MEIEVSEINCMWYFIIILVSENIKNLLLMKQLIKNIKEKQKGK